MLFLSYSLHELTLYAYYSSLFFVLTYISSFRSKKKTIEKKMRRLIGSYKAIVYSISHLLVFAQKHWYDVHWINEPANEWTDEEKKMVHLGWYSSFYETSFNSHFEPWWKMRQRWISSKKKKENIKKGISDEERKRRENEIRRQMFPMKARWIFQLLSELLFDFWS